MKEVHIMVTRKQRKKREREREREREKERDCTVGSLLSPFLFHMGP
jgi:hypothetical protein